MPLLLAIEPDRRQTSRITALAKNTLRAEIVAAETTQQAVAALSGRVPDLILTSLLLSSKDEAALADWLRDLDAAGAHVPTLVIPVLGTTRRRSANGNGGLLTRLTGRIGKELAPDGCDPAVFAAQISEYLERAAEERRAAAIALEDELSADTHESAVISHQSPAISRQSTVDGPEPIVDWQEPALAAPPEEEPMVDEPVPVMPAFEPHVYEEPVLRFVEPEPDLIAAAEPVTFEALEAEVRETTPDVVVAADVSAQEEEIVVNEPWDEIVLEDESDHGVELTAETIDLEKFVAELNAAAALDGQNGLERQPTGERLRPCEPEACTAEGEHQRKNALGVGPQRRWKSARGQADYVLSEFVEALEIMDATDPTAVVEDEPDRPGAHSAADSDLWMPLSFTAAWPQLEGGVAKNAPFAAARQQAASAADRGRRKKKAAAPPLQDEWGFFDPERCGFAALLAKLDEISDEEPPDTTTR